MKIIFTAVALTLATGAALAETAVYSSQAVIHAEGVYKTKYGNAQLALEKCKTQFKNIGPTRPSTHVVNGKDYAIIPHPAVKWAAEVDMKPRSTGPLPADFCGYLDKPDVTQWYKTNFHL